MKIFIVFMAIFIHCQLSYFSSSGQEKLISCLIDGDFTQNTCSDESGPGCLYFTNGCLPNWNISHGTPQILGNTGSAPNPYLFMWSGGSTGLPTYGEGVFAGYTFNTGQPYRLQMSASTSGGSGSIYVYAANGLTNQPSACGSWSPTISSLQLIGIYTPTLNAGWLPIDGSFVANGSYTQLWIFPVSATTTQYNLAIDWVDICPSTCATLGDPVIINQGQLASFISAKAIHVGSQAGSGGSGTVTISNTANTVLIANPNTDGIVLQPQFSATPTSGSFTAYIIPDCQTSSTRLNQSLNKVNIFDLMGKAAYWDSLTMTMKNVSNLPTSKISVYPVPSNGRITINDALLELSNSIITVTDLAGKELLSVANRTNTALLDLDLSKLTNGVYFLTIKTTSKSVTRKIIVSK